jgi:hypothetical protein
MTLRMTPFFALAAFLAIISSFGQTTAEKFPQRVNAGTWPILTAQDLTNGFYVVKPTETTLRAPKFLIPDEFTLKFDDKIKGPISWNFDNVEFGKRCTIQLAPRDKPVKPAKAADGIGQPPWGEGGRPGNPGNLGSIGKNGISLHFHSLAVEKHGSLWIDSAGGDGGDGGDGGNGGLGGGWSCGTLHEPRTYGGRGGDGGDGGRGGRGGDQAEVVVTIGADDPLPSPPCGEECGEHSMPEVVKDSDNGIIVLWGGVGCPGRGGQGGKGGKGGDGPSWNRKNCGPGRSDVYGGVDGRDGKIGYVDGTVPGDPCLWGQPGNCAPTHTPPPSQ